MCSLRSNLATKFLANWHYKDTRLDDELSVMIFDGYLELLDPNYSFFLASDIEPFEPYRLHLDDASQTVDVYPQPGTDKTQHNTGKAVFKITHYD